MLQKGVDERHALSEFFASLRIKLLCRTRGDYERESTIFMCVSVVTPQSRDRSAETEVYRLLSISDRFQVIAYAVVATITSSRSPRFLDVEKVSLILDV